MYIVGLFYLALPTKIKINSDKEQSIRCFFTTSLDTFPHRSTTVVYATTVQYAT